MNDSTYLNRLTQTRYARQLAERREVSHVEQLANFGLALGWACTLIGFFCWFCVVSRFDWVWLAMLVSGVVLLCLGLVIPEALERPCRIWMKMAHFQGWVVMTVLLTVIYFVLITPVGYLLRRRHGAHPFYSWDPESVPSGLVGWEKIQSRNVESSIPNSTRRRSLLALVLSTIGFFYGRGHYFVLPILILMLLLGVILFFVQGSVLAPFIYTIF